MYFIIDGLHLKQNVKKGSEKFGVYTPHVHMGDECCHTSKDGCTFEYACVYLFFLSVSFASKQGADEACHPDSV